MSAEFGAVTKTLGLRQRRRTEGGCKGVWGEHLNIDEGTVVDCCKPADVRLDGAGCMDPGAWRGKGPQRQW